MWPTKCNCEDKDSVLFLVTVAFFCILPEKFCNLNRNVMVCLLKVNVSMVRLPLKCNYDCIYLVKFKYSFYG